MKNILSDVVKASFLSWGKAGRCKIQFKKLDDSAFSVINCAFDEMSIYKPGSWDTWWAKEHSRFKIRGEQQRLLHEILFHFLTDYCYGKLQRDTKRKAKRSAEI